MFQMLLSKNCKGTFRALNSGENCIRITIFNFLGGQKMHSTKSATKSIHGESNMKISELMSRFHNNLAANYMRYFSFSKKSAPWSLQLFFAYVVYTQSCRILLEILKRGMFQFQIRINCILTDLVLKFTCYIGLQGIQQAGKMGPS